MQGLLNFLFGTFLSWFPPVAFWILFFAAALLYSVRFVGGGDLLRRFKAIITVRRLAGAAIVFRLLIAALYSFGQYYVWSGSALGRAFLNSPLASTVPGWASQWLHANPLGYFIFYSWGRFWLGELLSILVAYIFYLFLKLLQKYRERFFDEGEVTLGFLIALIVGWPAFVIFLPLIFVAVVLISLVRMLFFKQKYTTLGTPFLFAAFISLLWGDMLLNLFDLGVLRVS